MGPPARTAARVVERVVVAEEFDEVVGQAGEARLGKMPVCYVGGRGGAGGGVGEGVELVNWKRRILDVYENDGWRVRVELVQPKRDRNRRRVGRNGEVSSGVEELDIVAVVVGEDGDGGFEGREVVEEGDEMAADDPFLVGVGVGERKWVGAEEGVFDEFG